MPLPDFHVSDPFTLGIELEMQVVNPPGYDLSQDSSRLIDAVKPLLTAGEVKHDITESMLEMATGVCRNIDQASAELSAMQQIITRVAAEQHLAICGGGTHPFQNGNVRKSAMTNAIGVTWKISVISFSRRRYLASMCISAAQTATMPYTFCMACRDLFRILLRSLPLHLICRRPTRGLPARD